MFDNPDLLLRPDMFSEVKILSDTRKNTVVVPSEAVVRSGGHPQIFVVREPGKFEPRLVTLGVESEGRIEIIDGVNNGEEVVTSAQFLVDSESKLREATAKMMDALKNKSSESDADHSGHSAGHHDMTDHSGDMPESGHDNMHSGMAHGMSEEPQPEMSTDAHGGMIHD